MQGFFSCTLPNVDICQIYSYTLGSKRFVLLQFLLQFRDGRMNRRTAE